MALESCRKCGSDARSIRCGLLGVGLAALAGLAACGEDSTGSSTPPDISGPWVLVVAVESSQLDQGYWDRCIVDGSVQVAQEGDRFNAQVSNSSAHCSPGDTFGGPFPVNYDLTGGQIDGDKVTASDERCVYGGNIKGNPPDLIDGSATCTINNSRPMRGHWWFTRSTDSPSMADISGDWLLIASLGERGWNPNTCAVDGTFQLAQNGESVTGLASNSVVFCDLPFADGSLAGAWPGQLATDNFTAADTFDVCTYTGTVRGSPPNRMSGELTCRVSGLEGEILLGGPGELARLSDSSRTAD